MIYSTTDSGIILSVKILPNASEKGIKGVVNSADGSDWLRITVVSIPEKGKANKELIKFLSKELDIAKSDIEIISGESNHFKKLLIKKTSPDIVNKLEEWSAL